MYCVCSCCCANLVIWFSLVIIVSSCVQVSELAFPKIPKPAQMRLQAAADRALSEQVAVIRCWRQARSCLSQWTEHASAVAPTLQGVSKRYRSVVEQTAQELQEKSSSLSQITQALREAEVARIRSTAEDPNLTDTSSRSASFRGNSSASSAAGVPISPLDSLSRGSAGREVAALVNALRASKDELADSAQVVSTLGTKLVSELRRELELFSHTEGNLTSAVDTTQRLLQSSRPGANIGGTLQEEEPPSGAASAGLRKGTRRRAAETSSPKAGPTGSRKLVATPLSSRPAFDLSLS